MSNLCRRSIKLSTMTHYHPQLIFDNIIKEKNWTTEMEDKAWKYITENIYKISFGMSEAVRCGAQTFNMDILNTIKLES